MISIAITNRKGGTGKTTVSTHVAAGLAHQGKNVCLIDTDPQGDAATMLGMTPKDDLFNLIVEDREMRDCIREVRPAAYQTPDAPAAGEFFIVSSSARTSMIPSLIQDPFKFAAIVNELKSVFDVVILDTAPTVSMFDGSVYMATDAFVFVTLPHALSYKGLNEGLAQVMQFNDTRKKLGHGESRLIGILPNMVQANTINDRENLSELAENYQHLVWSPLMMRTKLKEASNFGELIYVYEPTSYESNEMHRISERVLREVTHVE